MDKKLFFGCSRLLRSAIPLLLILLATERCSFGQLAGLLPTEARLVPTESRLVPVVNTLSGPGKDSDEQQKKECCRPTTLFQWSYGTVTNGPDPSATLNSDRPDFTESAVTVGQGITQWELGYTYSFSNDGTSQLRSHSYPESLLRAGMLADWFELRVGWNYASGASKTLGGGQESYHGSEDLYLGVKLALTPQDGMLPAMALIPQTMVPVGSGGLSAGECLPGVNWTYSWDLSDRWSLAGQTQINRALDTVTNRPFLDFSQSASIGLSITERIGGYFEWYCMVPDGADVDPTLHYINGGMTYLVNDYLQLDWRVGHGLSAVGDDYFAGSGLVFRY